MKVGLILECHVDGPDEKVLYNLLDRFKPGIEIGTLPHDSKANLLQKCVTAAKKPA